MPFPNNPTGAIMTYEDLKDIVDIIIEKDLFVISDEIYSELTYGGKEHVTTKKTPPQGVFFHINFSGRL